jgi:ribosome-associated heat shock protein Hsp15
VSAPETMRLDRFLWWARLTKTRGQAQELATAGHLRLDGRRIERAAAGVRIGSVIGFFRGGRVRVVRVESLPVRRGPAPEAQALYTELANDSQQGAAALTPVARGHSEAPENPRDPVP